MNRDLRLAALAFLFLAAGGCCGNRQTIAEKPGSVKPTDPNLTPIWSVRIGSSGGFTGGGSGHLILADGTVRSWSQITPGDPITMQDFGKLTPEALAGLREALADPALADLKYDKTGNLTGSLEWFDGEKLHTWTWAERIGDVDIPPLLQRVRTAAMAAVRSAAPPPK